MQISRCIDSNVFNQSDSNISLGIIRYEAAVEWLNSLIGSLQVFTLIIPRIGSFQPLHYTICTEKVKVFSLH